MAADTRNHITGNATASSQRQSPSWLRDPLTQASEAGYEKPFSDINTISSDSEADELNEDDNVNLTDSAPPCAPMIDGLSIEVMELRFAFESEYSTIEEAEALYFNYARAKGFGVRKDLKRKYTDGKLKSRRWVCSKQGFRPQKFLLHQEWKRGPRAQTRTGCKAEFRVCYNPHKGCWFAKFFTAGHNHDLTPAHHVHYIRSHRRVSEPDIAAATAMKRVGIRPSQIHEYMVQRAGSYSHVGYLRKDLQNAFRSNCRHKLKDSDSESCIAYLEGKRSTDPSFYYQYTIDAENRLADLFWCDGGSRADYAIFGDVIAFDATYRTNAYRKPLVIMVGINHHMRTTIFGFALLTSETEHVYSWLLECFLHAMDGRQPQTVITDGDKAMRKAISKIFPQSIHRLCCWHMERNAQTNVKNNGFTAEFKDCMLYTYNDTDFQRKWEALVNKHKVEHHEWVKKVYDDRYLWAEAYLVGHFFGGMRSTQRCEGLHGYLNQYVSIKLRLIDFVDQMARLMGRQREIEGKDDYDSFDGRPVLTTHLIKYEEHASNIYTRAVFREIQHQISKEGILTIKAVGADNNNKTYRIREFQKPDKEWEVVFHQPSHHASCQCKLFESKGIPCSHSFSVLKTEDIELIPESMQLSRWMKQAKFNSTRPRANNSGVGHYMSQQARIGCLHAACSTLLQFAAHSLEAYNEAMMEIQQLRMRLHASYSSSSQSSAQRNNTNPNRIEDPVVVLTKGSTTQNKTGAPKKRRKCSKCSQLGHTVRTCRSLTPTNRCHGNNSTNCNAPNSAVQVTCATPTAAVTALLSAEALSHDTCSPHTQSARHQSQTAVLFQAPDLSLMGSTTYRENDQLLDETVIDLGQSLPATEIDSTKLSPWLPSSYWPYQRQQ